MAKKREHKTKTVKTITTTVEAHHHNKHNKSPKKIVPKNIEVNLAKNIIELQKIHTNLIEKFDNLANQVSKLLELFESTAKSFTEHPEMKVSEKDKDFLEKIDKLLEQNKTIAKGLTMVEERTREKIATENPNPYTQMGEQFRPSIGNRRPMPRF